MMNNGRRRGAFVVALVFVATSMILQGCRKKAEESSSTSDSSVAPSARAEVPAMAPNPSLIPPLLNGGTNLVVQVGQAKLTEAELNQQLQ